MNDRSTQPTDAEIRLFPAGKRVVLIAHDKRKADMMATEYRRSHAVGPSR